MWLSLSTAINDFRERTGLPERTALAVVHALPKKEFGLRFKVHSTDLEEAINKANQRPETKPTTEVRFSEKKRNQIREIGLPVRRTA